MTILLQALYFTKGKNYSTEKLATLPKVTQLEIVELGVELGPSDVDIFNHFPDAVITHLLPPTTLHACFL